MHRTTNRFWNCFHALAARIQDLARKNYALLKENPHHPSLHFKKVGNLWSVRIGIEHRALAIEDEDGYIWVWIGDHQEYDRMLS
ncbi:ParE family toxin-like protein [Thiocystis violacea]|uniref:ParE family toxin-like protein n=1 Tax=Thiocystis violacea TaxID=13725 RepID=UPI003F86DE3F|nr:hypothetical protein [Thiocystis violacea]